MTPSARPSRHRLWPGVAWNRPRHRSQRRSSRARGPARVRVLAAPVPQRHTARAAACLSLFAATFDAGGAAAVLYGLDASAQQQAETVTMLRDLRGVSVVQELPAACRCRRVPLQHASAGARSGCAAPRRAAGSR